MHPIARILVALASTASIGFGAWHFFVPRAWNWYAYIDARATELVLAVRAINIFFSLSLVLFGGMNLAFLLGERANRYSCLVLLAATSLLWLTRVVLQVILPQGTIQPALQYGMLVAFVLIAAGYLAGSA